MSPCRETTEALKEKTRETGSALELFSTINDCRWRAGKWKIKKQSLSLAIKTDIYT